MISARWYKVGNDLWQNKLRTLLIVLSIAVGLFAVGTILSTRTVLATEMARSYEAIRPSSGVVRTVQPFSESFVDSVRKMDEVAAVEARRVVDVRMQLPTGEWKNVRLFAVADYDQMQVNIIRPESGAWPPPPEAMLIERAALPLLQAEVGDTLLVETAAKQQRRIPIAGLAHDLAQVPAQFDGTPYGYIHMATLRWLGEPYGFNELDIVAANADDKAVAQQQINAVKTKAEKTGLVIPLSLTVEPGQLPLEEILQAVLLLMGLLGVLALFLSAFLIVNTVTALLAQQKRQIGIIKAVGGSSRQLIGMYLVMVLVYGVLALLLAAPLSRVGARSLAIYLAGLFNFDLGEVVMPLTAVWVQGVVGLLVPVLASLYPFLANLRLSPAAAMHNVGLETGESSKGVMPLLSGAKLWFARHRLQRPWLLSLRNTFRSQGRLVLTLVTLALAGATFISVFSVNASLGQTVDSLMGWWNFDVMIVFDRPYRVPEIQQTAQQTPGVTDSDGWLQLPVRRVRPDGTESAAIFLFASRADSELVPSPAIVDGRWLRPEDKNALVVNAIFLQEEPDVQVGDEIVLKVEGKETPFVVVGVSLGVLAPMAHANYDYMARLTGNVQQADAALVATRGHDEAAIKQMTAVLETRFERAGLNVSNVQTVLAERSEAQASFNIIVALLLIMALLLAVVGGLGLMGTMSINVLERTREIGVLRAVGASNNAVALVFIREGMMVGVLSWLLGTGLALPLSKLLSNAVGVPLMGVPLSFAFSTAGVWVWLGLVLLLSALASLVPARNAARLTVREVLAYE